MEKSGEKAPHRPLKIKGDAKKMPIKRDTRREAKKASGRVYMIKGKPRGFCRTNRTCFQKK
jgi:hypothetical protein